jgi:hypothetical protein
VEGLAGITHCLTVRQPHATLLVEGPCRVINRASPSPKSHLGKRVAIYAAGIPDNETCVRAMRILEAAGVSRASRMMWKTRTTRGAVIGTAVLVVGVTESADPWFTGPFGLVFAEPVAFADPLVMDGRDGFWRIG